VSRTSAEPAQRLGEIIPTHVNARRYAIRPAQVIGAIGILRDMRAYERVLRDLEESRRELARPARRRTSSLRSSRTSCATAVTACSLGGLLRIGRLAEATAVQGSGHRAETRGS